MTFAEQMVEKLQARCLELAGVTSTSGDGESAAFSDLKKELAYWESRVAREAGTKPRLSEIKMGN